MSLNSFIISTLQPFAPVAFQNYNGASETYITFFEFNQRGALYADDEEKKTSYSIQVDIWSKSDYTTLVKQVRDTLIAKGFIRTYETELYEENTGIYHKVFRFNYVK